jgi:plasmid stability protein
LAAPAPPPPHQLPTWTRLLATCFHMVVKTLYIRNVPEDVADRLAVLASREGVSVNAFVVKELSAASRRADNRALLADLPNIDGSLEEIVEIIREARGPI